jgi:fructose-1,6-bisphosphatase/inositol monophosphatase family enzyme
LTSPHDPEASWYADRLEQLGFAIRRHLARVTARGDEDLAVPVAHEGGDTIFAIDRHVEQVLVDEIEAWPEDYKSLLLIAEGLGSDGRLAFGPDGGARYRLIVDPIDGTRGLMYDKRSAWFLAAIARDSGEHTGLRDAFAAVMVELPTSKQAWCDSFAAVAGWPTRGRRVRVDGEESRPLVIRPSAAEDLEFGFAQVSNFFPGTKVLASELMERIAERTLGQVVPGRATIFDDQYICTGGQMVELMCGHDRFCCDLRPLLYEIIAKRTGEAIRGMECHPYDIAGALVAQQAGVIITDGFGAPLDAPLDVLTGVHWCGYANRTIARKVQPVINQWLSDHGVAPRASTQGRPNGGPA